MLFVFFFSLFFSCENQFLLYQCYLRLPLTFSTELNSTEFYLILKRVFFMLFYLNILCFLFLNWNTKKWVRALVVIVFVEHFYFKLQSIYVFSCCRCQFSNILHERRKNPTGKWQNWFKIECMCVCVLWFGWGWKLCKYLKCWIKTPYEITCIHIHTVSKHIVECIETHSFNFQCKQQQQL